MNRSSTSAVTPGHANVSTPIRMPQTPTTASHQRGAGTPPVIAAITAHTPSTRANAP
jgi:hypothetical protein